jgi:hypothetical protein
MLGGKMTAQPWELRLAHLEGAFGTWITTMLAVLFHR